MRDANRHLESWQSAELKALMSKPCERQDLERTRQALNRKTQIDLNVASRAKALSELYHDDATVQAQDPTVSIALKQLTFCLVF